MQLELMPHYYYYNTLGFDKELSDYIDFVNDDIVIEIIRPLYKNGGRRPIDPRVYFRMHYLYYTRPEITSFRQLELQLKDPKNQAWRNFIGVHSPKDVPSHSSLSVFRKKIGVDLFYAINLNLLAQALQIPDFLSPTLTGIDSRPVWANVNGYKHKRCSCLDQENCDCEKQYSDPDAKVGVQRNKANQNKFFIGYRKHSIVCPSKIGPVVLFSIVLPTDTGDVNVMLPLIEMLNKVEGLNVEYLVADLAYLDAKKHQEALKDHNVAVVTGVKKTTIIPESCSFEGKPECQEGHPLVFDGFDRESSTAHYTQESSICKACVRQGLCNQQFAYDFDDSPFFFGPVPQNSLLQKKMMTFRKQVELAFAQESNQLTSVMKHKKVPVRSTERVQVWFVLRDTFQLIQRMLAFIREEVRSAAHYERIDHLQSMQVEKFALAPTG